MAQFSSCNPTAGFLNLGTIDILDQIILCY